MKEKSWNLSISKKRWLSTVVILFQYWVRPHNFKMIISSSIIKVMLSLTTKKKLKHLNKISEKLSTNFLKMMISKKMCKLLLTKTTSTFSYWICFIILRCFQLLKVSLICGRMVVRKLQHSSDHLWALLFGNSFSQIWKIISKWQQLISGVDLTRNFCKKVVYKILKSQKWHLKMIM